MSSLPQRLARFLCGGKPCDEHVKVGQEVYDEIVNIQAIETEREEMARVQAFVNACNSEGS